MHARRQADAIATASDMALGAVMSLSSQPVSRYGLCALKEANRFASFAPDR